MGNTKILLKNLLFICIVPSTFGGWLPWSIGSRDVGPSGWWQWPGLLLLIAGGTVVLLCIWDFARQGRGTPFPLDPAENLVTNRLYRYTRNPMYLGVLLVMAGWAAWFSSADLLLYTVVMGMFFALFVFFVEEPMLRRQFGSAYAAYCERVPRWFRKRWRS